MRSLLLLALIALLNPLTACSGDGGGAGFMKAPCEDGQDNDGDGAIDFPDDLGCNSESDDTEDSLPEPQCKDGRDNDGDGKKDYPTDPGCFASHQDDEVDDCPDGPSCPQCSDGKDNDGNGTTDYPDDSGGCAAASDTDEYTQNPVACGSNVQIKKLPFDGHATGTLNPSGASSLVSPTCGGAGIEDVWELRVASPKVIVATTDLGGTAMNTVLYLRGAQCVNNASEMSCSDDISSTNNKSSLTHSIVTPGTYYLVVDAKDSTAGAYELDVKFLTGEGETCSGADDCGPGLVCRVPGGGTQKVCTKPVCEDSFDDDMDNDGTGYPNDPGCTSPQDDDEADGCPGVGPNCPECGDGIDNDGDGKTDFGTGGDTTCTSASNASEACVATDGVATITVATTMGTTAGATNDVKVSCATTGTHTAPEKTYRLDLPAMANLSIAIDTTWSNAVALYDATCTGTAVQCESFADALTFTNLAAGTYYLVVDGYSTGSGAYTITVSGHIQNGQSCESPLAQAAANGAITCATGYACKGAMGSRTCQVALCSDGVDNDGDSKIDFPFDPGCSDPADDSEPNPATAPVCADMMDNDGDSSTDFPADFGCQGAGGTSEQFCVGETDAPNALIASSTASATTAMKANDWMPTCGASATTSSAPDTAHPLQLPVAVETLVLDTIGSSFDTVLTLYDAQCGNVVGCDDDGGGSLRSQLTLSNVSPGGYAVVVDGYNTANGAYTLNIKGTVAQGTACSSPLFSGATPVLVCPMGTTCKGSPLKCLP